MAEGTAVARQETSSEVPEGIDADDPRRELFERREEWDVDASWQRYVGTDNDEDQDEDEWELYLTLKGGKSTAKRWMSETRAAQVLATPPVHVAVFDGLVGLRFGTDEAEIGLRSLSPLAVSDLRRLPWATHVPANSRGDAEEVDNEPLPEEAIGRGDAWSLSVANMPRALTAALGSASARFLALYPRTSPGTLTTITVKGLDVRKHDEAKAALEELLGDLAFEFDLKYGIAFGPQAAPAQPGVGRLPRGRRSYEAPPAFPTQTYGREPLSLYWYGRSATNMPLLRYLAFYQVLEFHFPQFFQRELLDRVQKELKDPRFQPGRDSDVSRLLALMNAGAGKRGSEVDQLTATIRACLTSEAILEYVNSDPRIRQAVTGKRLLEGVSQLNLEDKSHDLRDQVAKRVYAIRCRIVHTKDDDVSYGSRMLLPFSPEAERLGVDVSLVQFLAQKVLIASSRERA
jgi:hypothetical protein